MKTTILVSSILLTAAAVAAPAAKRDPVAAGYPDWEVTPAQHLFGAEITASDLRQRLTLVFEFPGKDLLRELESIGTVQELLETPIGMQGEWLNVNWMGLEWPRKVKLLLSHRGDTALKPEAFTELMAKKVDQKTNPGFVAIRKNKPSIYEQVRFAGGPEAQGKSPFVYLMGESGLTPLWTGEWKGKSTLAELKKVLKEQIAKLPEWHDFYGSVLEPEFFKAQMHKAIAAKKGFAGLLPVLKKGIASKNEATSKEAQILYDAIMQYRGDLSHRVLLEAKQCPPRAICDGNSILKAFPDAKKSLAPAMEEARKEPDAEVLAKMLTQILVWDDPDFVCKNAAEAKKNVATLEKFNKTIEPYTESKSKRIQDAACLIRGRIEDLISLMPNKVK